jgi:WD40 repeat protein
MAKILHYGPISSVAAHGVLWASAGYDNRVILWDCGSGVPRAVAQGMHDHLVNHCEFSADGGLLVSASSDYSARIWSVPTLRLCALLTGHEDDVDMATFSPDGQWVGTCALDRKVRVFDLQGRCHHTFAGHTGNIISLLWRPDGQHLVSSSVDGTVREWSLAQGAQTACHALQSVRTDSIVLDHLQRILAGDDRGRIAIIHPQQIVYVAAHQAGIKKLVFCPARRILVSLSYDRTLAVWRISADGRLHEQRRTELPALVWSRAAAVLDADRLLVGTFGTQPAVYDWVRDHWDLTGIVADGSINAVAMHQGECWSVGDAGTVKCAGAPRAEIGSLCNFLVSTGERLFTGGQLGQLFDTDGGGVLHQHRSPLNCGVWFARNGRAHLAIGTYTGEILVFALNPGRALTLVAEIPVYENAVKGLAATNGELFSVCASTAIAWHDCDTLQPIRRIDHAHDKIANACAVAGAGQLATVARDRKLRLWTDGRAEVFPSPHGNSVKSLAATPDGTRLLSGSYGGTIAEFDVPGRRWSRFERLTTSGISSITYDSGRACFLAAAYDGEIHVIK